MKKKTETSIIFIVWHYILILWIFMSTSYINGILPKGPYPPCLRMADRAVLAGYHIYIYIYIYIYISDITWHNCCELLCYGDAVFLEILCGLFTHIFLVYFTVRSPFIIEIFSVICVKFIWYGPTHQKAQQTCQYVNISWNVLSMSQKYLHKIYASVTCLVKWGF